MIPFADMPLISLADGVRQPVRCSRPACGVTYEATRGVLYIPALAFFHHHTNRHAFMAVPYCTKTCERLHLHEGESYGVRQTALAL